MSDRAKVCHILKDSVTFLYPKAAHLDYHMNGTHLIFTAFLLDVQQDLSEAACHQFLLMVILRCLPREVQKDLTEEGLYVV